MIGSRALPDKLSILLLHGYALEGSGSNVYTNHLSQHLAHQGHRVHIMCQEPGPYPDHVARITTYDELGRGVSTTELEHPTGVVELHRPALGAVLPVYNWDRYPGFDEVVPFTELSDEQLETYVDSSTKALLTVVRRHRIDVVHANHVIAMPEVARRVFEVTGVPFVVMPHGSAIEYAVRLDERYKRLAEAALKSCAAVIVGGDEMLRRMDEVWGPSLGHRAKSHHVPTGVDLDLFQPLRDEEKGALALDGSTPVTELSPPGNSRALARQLVDSARAAPSDDALGQIVRDHRGRYTPRSADADLHEKLDALGVIDNPTVFFGGKLVAGKGVHSLLAAMAYVAAKCDEARLVIVGEGSFREALELLVEAMTTRDHALFCRVQRLGWRFDGKPQSPLRELAPFVEPASFRALAEMARFGELSRKVAFVGFLAHPSLAELLRHSQVAVLPSAVPEAYPLALAEALASGTLPVVTDHGGARYFADEVASACGIARDQIAVDAHPDRVVLALASALVGRLAPDSLHEQRLARQLRRYAEQAYGWPSIAKRNGDVYRRATRCVLGEAS